MKLIKPYYRIFPFKGMELLKNIEKYGRTCYKSESKFTDKTATDFIQMILENGHESVIEHEKITVLFVCDRGVSHEVVRHRIASYSQESTRYCNYSKDKFNNQITFIIPNWLDLPEGEHDFSLVKKVFEEQGKAASIWLQELFFSEETYMQLINNEGWSPQQARSVLPNALKTEIVITYNLREWRHFFKLRTAVSAHPQMKELTIPLLYDLKKQIPVIFDDINILKCQEPYLKKGQDESL